MIAKKNSRYDLERKRIVLLQIGLMTVGSLTLAAFTYETPFTLEQEKREVAYQPVNFITEDYKPKDEKKELVIEQKETSKDKQQSSQKNSAVSQNMKATKNTKTKVKSGVKGELGIPKGPGTGGTVIITSDDTVDEFPSTPTVYIGGRVAMQKHINLKIRYPEDAIRFGDEGTVYVTFIIEKDGSVSNVEVIRGVTHSIDREAKRVVRKFPNWKPAENAYGKVRTRVRLPIVFQLN